MHIPLNRLWRSLVLWLVTLMLAGLLASPAQALPSFARQTGSDCVACHIGGYGWHLTPYGIRFKLGGYTDTDGKENKVPLSVQLQFEKVKSNRAEWGGSDYARLDSAEVYLAGRLANQVGIYSQVQTTNYTGTKSTSLNKLDLRVVHEIHAGDKDLVLGLSLNNSPGVQDAMDTFPAWGWYALAPMGQGNALNTASSGLHGRVLGLSAYAFYDQSWYGEVGSYRRMSGWTQDTLGKDISGDPGRISSSSYWRLGYMKDWKTQYFSVGLVGFNLNRQLPTDTATNRYNDLGLDGMYEYLGDRQHIVQIRGTYNRERRRYGAPGADLDTGLQIERTLSATYIYDQTYGITVARTTAHTNTDPVRYGNGKGDSGWNYVELSWKPLGKEDSWLAPYANLHLALGFSKPDKFNGSSTDAFGDGSLNPSRNDLNQVYATLQVSF